MCMKRRSLTHRQPGYLRCEYVLPVRLFHLGYNRVMDMDCKGMLGTIREPMREWWVRVLRWWAAPLVVWLGWSLWYGAWYFPHVSELNWPIQTQYWLTLVSDIIGLAFTPTALVLWSVATWRANRLISDECVPASGNSNESTLLPARFIAGLWQGWWPLGLVLAGSIITGLVSGFTSTVESLGFPLWQLNLYQACTSPFDLLAIMLWQCAICALLHNQAKLWWTWTAILLVLGHLVSLFFGLTFALGINLQMLNAFAPTTNGWEWAIGLAVMLTLTEALRSRWQWLKYAVYSVVVASVIVAKLYIYNWWIWYSRFDSLGVQISNGLVMFTPWLKLFSFNPIVALPGGITNISQSPGWVLATSSPVYHITGHPAWVIPATLLGNLLWFALLTCVLYFFSLRPNREPAG